MRKFNKSSLTGRLFSQVEIDAKKAIKYLRPINLLEINLDLKWYIRL